jgi:hypothetical protein
LAGRIYDLDFVPELVALFMLRGEEKEVKLRLLAVFETDFVGCRDIRLTY